MSKKIWLSPPHMGGEEWKLVQEAFQTNWISPVGPHIEQFEKDLAHYHNMPAAAVLTSGTAAIHLALIILGVKQGDEVLCSSFTFSGTCNPVMYQQATPVFIDSDRETWNMDPGLLERAIEERIKLGKKPKAMIVVHLYGMPAQMKAIMSIAKKYEIPVIEDAAEALGTTIDGQYAGTFGDFGIFSFNGNKIITTSGGGALVSRNEAWIRKAKFLATQARDPAPHYQHSEVGYNYRMSNVSAAIGIGQLRVLNDRVSKRRDIFNFYVNAFRDIKSISFQPEMSGSYSNRWLTTILVRDSRVTREDIRLTLESNNIESRPLWKPMHMQPVFASAPAYTNGVSEELFEFGLCLPSGTAMTLEECTHIARLVRQLF